MSVRQLWDFFLHLRLHYQIFILSGPFLLGGVLVPEFTFGNFALQFLTVHVFLFGGVTAYNSYWDKDQSPIGGLKNPPPMTSWMLAAAWAFQVMGLALAYVLETGIFFIACFLLAMLMFWLYSSPMVRWKGRPFMSLVAIGISTGFCSLAMGYFASGGKGLPVELGMAGLGCALLVLSLYPLSQVYQVEEDQRRGDTTFAIRFGLRGVQSVYALLYPAGLVLVSFSLWVARPGAAMVLAGAGGAAGLVVWSRIKRLKMRSEEYEMVMKIKYGVSLAFVLFLVYLIWIKAV